MRRFSRRRRAGAPSGSGSPIDAERWLGRICEEGVVDASSLEPVCHDEVAADYAAVGRGERADGSSLVVSYSPRAGDALMAALVTAARLAEDESYAGEVIAIGPQWSVSDRRRLGVVRAELPFKLSTLAAPTLSESALTVEPETALEPSVVPVDQVSAHLGDPTARDLFARAAVALEGLASKHGGCVRGVGQAVELVIMARRVAELRADDNGVVLTTLLPQRATARLSLDSLAGALDALEGQLRRRMNDRRIRDGEEGMRARLLPLLARSRSLRQVVAWPLGGGDRDEIDLFGLDSEVARCRAGAAPGAADTLGGRDAPGTPRAAPFAARRAGVWTGCDPCALGSLPRARSLRDQAGRPERLRAGRRGRRGRHALSQRAGRPWPTARARGGQPSPG
ncbi:MAG: hypothetical protein JRG92_05815 [Deltaproteobacteria bacterium]|nr:hypothetical protein [Deltaproteobacteria bacterium]